jgi:hypothetical protein
MEKHLKHFILMTIILCSCSSTKIVKTEKQNSNLFLTTLESADVGKVSFYMDYTENNDNFEMFTKKNADIKLFGFLKAMGGRIFMNTMKNGSLINIKGVVKNDSLIGKLISPLGSFDFISIKKKDSIVGKLMYQDKKIGTFSSILSKKRIKVRDYKKLIDKAIDITEYNIYNPNLVKTNDWNTFKKKIIKKAIYFEDDLELITYFFYASNKLPFSHFNILNKDYSSAKNKGEILYEKISDETILLKIKNFNKNKDIIKSTIVNIIESNYKNLIIDLRSNRGGNIESALTLTSYLIEKPLYGGYFITQKWYKDNTDSIPNNINTSGFPVFSKANYNLLIEGIHKHKGLILKVNPADKYFNGKVFILTNNSTASTCEPIVYGLKINKRAIIIGEKTSGAMLSAEPFELFDNFKLFLPTADYYTSDGKRIDKIGVMPTFETESENALKYVLDNLIE